MARSDYQVLGLNNSASQDDIRKAYRRLALRYHPDKNSEVGAEEKFKEITKAYHSLISSNGEEKLRFEDLIRSPFAQSYGRFRFPSANDRFFDSDRYSDSSSEDDFVNEYCIKKNIYEDICKMASAMYGTEDVFTKFKRDLEKSEASASETSSNTESEDGEVKEKTDSADYLLKDIGNNQVECNLFVTLEELINGGSKRITVPKERNGGSKTLKINIKPGNPIGARIIFPKVCLENGGQPKNFVVVICPKPHDKFSLDGNNIKFEAKISLQAALCGAEITVPTLDGEELVFTRNDVIKPETEHRLVGFGLPLSVEGKERGDLIVTFRINFPNKLSLARKRIIKVALPP